jgi:phage-related protein
MKDAVDWKFSGAGITFEIRELVIKACFWSYNYREQSCSFTGYAFHC